MNSILNVLANDFHTIPYRKELNELTGAVTATILLQQVIYWWYLNNQKAFYKFISPSPENEKYNVGDSWIEELGFTKYEFNSAYKKLEDLGLISKKINMMRVTYYTLHASKLGKLIKPIYVSRKKQSIQVEKTDDDITEITTEITTKIERENKFSFSLSKQTSFENLSEIYCLKLEQEVNNLNGKLKYEDFVLGLEAGGYKYKNFLSAYKKWNKKEDAPVIIRNGNTEQKEYAWSFKKAKDTSDKIKDWLEFEMKINWLDNHYWENIPIKGKGWAVGWQKVTHPYLDKPEILLFKYGTPESVFLENNKTDDILDIEIVE